MADLLIHQLKAAIADLLEKKGIRARIEDKVNRRGEVVIGVILERTVTDEELRRDWEAAEAEAKTWKPR